MQILKIIGYTILLGGFLLFLHMRFGCTGVYGTELVMYTYVDGHEGEYVACEYVGWSNFKFTLLTPWRYLHVDDQGT